MPDAKLREDHELVRVRHDKHVNPHEPTTTRYTQKQVAPRVLRHLKNKPMQKPLNHDVANGRPNAVAYVAQNTHSPQHQMLCNTQQTTVATTVAFRTFDTEFPSFISMETKEAILRAKRQVAIDKKLGNKGGHYCRYCKDWTMPCSKCGFCPRIKCTGRKKYGYIERGCLNCVACDLCSKNCDQCICHHYDW
jgi:hypothetical protein